jgi:glycerophosphoryl diester phosphodiesterase
MTDCLTAFPLVIGHRGAAGRAPENTLAGFREAARLGVAWVEFDVRLSADGVAVLSHDAIPRRTTGHSRPIAETPAATLLGLDAGAWFSPEFAGERLPRLDTVLKLLATLRLGAVVELKSSPGRAEGVVQAVADCLALAWPAVDAPPLMVLSFDADMVAAAAGGLPRVRRAWINEKLPENGLQMAIDLGCHMIHLGRRGLTRRDAAVVKAAGLGLAVYTVNKPEQARRLWAWGADSVFSDRPDLILAANAN